MKKIVYTLLVLFMIGVAGTVISISASGGFSIDTYTVTDKVNVNSNGINHIKIDLSSTDVSLLPTNDDEITVELNGKNSKKLKRNLKLEVQEKAGTLDISLNGEDQIKFNIGVIIVDTSVDVYVPEKLYKSITVQTSSGDIDMKNLRAQDIYLKASSGEVRAENTLAESSFKIVTSSGDAHLKNNEAEEFELVASSGELTANNQKSMKAVFTTSSGDITLIDVLGDIKAVASSGSISVQNEEVAGHIDAQASSGDVEIEFAKEPTSLSINFKGSSGEGYVDYSGVSYSEKSENHIVGKMGSGEFDITVKTNSGDFVLR